MFYKYVEPYMFESFIMLQENGSIGQFLCVQGRDNKILPPDQSEPNVVYHYCSNEAFVNIISNRTMWLSSLSYTNDEKEVIFIYDLLHDYIKTLKLNEKEYFRLVYLVKLIHLNLHKSYSTCFTEIRDGLLPWQSYGKQGVAISINPKLFPVTRDLPGRTDMKLHATAFINICYDTEQQKTLIKDIVDKVLTKEIAIPMGASFLAKMACVTKDPFWKEEKEWRLLYTPIPIMESIEKTLPNETFNNIDFGISKIKTRQKSNLTIPYCEFPIIDNLITEIIIGPENSIKIQDVLSLLNKVNLNNVKVTKSKAPLRAI